MKIRPARAELFDAGGWTDGQTDMTKLIVTFCNFANVPKIRKFKSGTRTFVKTLETKPHEHSQLTVHKTWLLLTMPFDAHVT
jgi:hypothetical protein